MGPIDYRYGNDLDLDQVIDLYRDSTLGERRPIDDRAIVEAMLRHANLVVTAWEGERLVGLSRTLTDFAYVGYLSDLAVALSHQKLGIGTELMARTRAQDGPALDAGAARGAQGRGLLPEARLQAARQRLGAAGGRRLRGAVVSLARRLGTKGAWRDRDSKGRRPRPHRLGLARQPAHASRSASTTTRTTWASAACA